MQIDTAKTAEAFGKLTPVQAGVVVILTCLAMVAGAGWIIHTGLNEVHVDLIEVKGAVDRSNTDAKERSDRYFETQERLIGVLERLVALQAATCLSSSNGSTEDRRRCEAVMAGMAP